MEQLTTTAEVAQKLDDIAFALLLAGEQTARGELHPGVFEAHLEGAILRASEAVDDYWYRDDLRMIADPSLGADPEDRASGVASALNSRARRLRAGF